MIELIEVTYMGLSPLEQKISDRIRSGCNVKLLGDSLTIGSGSSDTDLNGTARWTTSGATERPATR